VLKATKEANPSLEIRDALAFSGPYFFRDFVMKQLASLFIGKPVSILTVAAVFLVTYILQRYIGFGSKRHPRSLLVVAIAWVVYATWEWLILFHTPEANIRVDLMVIWPILFLVSIWLIIRAFK
jgi:hypothetical protein